MWRWVTRGLVLSVVLLLLTSAAVAQTVDFVGSVDSPDPGQTQSGVVLVKGWAIDPGQITKIELYVDDQFQFLANTGQPRIDIIEAYPNYPGIHNIGPGFTIGFLASRFSNGPHTVAVRVYTSDHGIIELGRRTITIDNTLNQSPFGSVDMPDGAATYNASGSFPVVGWAADTDGIARVDVAIDDGILQSVLYGDSRPDVGNVFPDFPGALFSGFIANIDTTRIQDGVHLLTVRATDRLGLSRLIGRRQVQIFNSNSQLKPFGYLDEPRRDTVLYGTKCATVPPLVISPSIPVNNQSHITPVRGWALDLGTRGDIGRVSYAELMIDGVRWYSTDDCGYSTIFSAYVNCYGLPRYDVERFYPNYPDAPRSGFMFTLDVGALLALGVRPGNHVMKVRVGDQQQTFAELPSRDGIPVFFQCAEETHDFASLGFIDVPTTYDYVKGNVTFQGWALDENGGVIAVEIIVDGNFIGQAQYGFNRSDVAQQYPNINVAASSGWRFTMDTNKLANSRHRLTVRVLDAQGNRSEIGS
ncbi:MAG: Ig-like domain-containing protein, partial [Acidobacteriota bacterium]